MFALSAAQQVLHRTLGHDNIVCRVYLDPHDKFTRVVSPEVSNAVMSNATLSTIDVAYTGFTAQAQTAFQAAVNIWKTQVASTVTITINANFSDFGDPPPGDPVLLGQASPTCFFRDFPNAFLPATLFPVALANHSAGVDLLPFVDEFNTCTDPSDIFASFNSKAAWYFGTDGFVPMGQVDFVSVVLHELSHGLGFLGTGTVVTSSGTALGRVGTSDGPFIYDVQVVDNSGQSILNTTVYPNNSAGLAALLTSGNGSGAGIFLGGQGARDGNGGIVRPRLYAPSTFSNGSSYSHLDEATYPAGDLNSLMTPIIGTAEAIHTPGPITLGLFTDMGWGTQCSYGLDQTSATVPAAAGTVNVTVSAPAGCFWQASVPPGFVSITSGQSGNGAGIVRLAVLANATASARSVTMQIAGQNFTLTQNPTGPAMSLDKTSLIFGAVNTGAAFSSQTGPQTVRLTQTGAGAVSWTAASTTPWLLVSPASGSGSATLTISVQFAAGLGATQNGSITLTFSGAGSTAGPITVTLKSLNGAQVSAPTGAFDTPVNGITGVTGSIGLTGWAMDDIQVIRVRILRDPVAGEPAGLVFIGDASIVDGARPDIQALFPNNPRNTFGGWGYLMLTVFLPNLGNGTFKLYAIADDAEGHSTTLGSKTITCANSSATTPFGAIDTPAQGGSVTGASVANFGWVLSPNPRRADPPGGGTVRIVIDGALIAQVPGQWTSRSDLSALFPAAQYEGIGTALGVAVLDTTTLPNGVHTISWNVTDNLGSAVGIGSRFFTVANGALYADPSEAGAIGRASNVITGSAVLSIPRAAALRLATPGALAGEVDAAPVDTHAISGRHGYDFDAPLGAYRVRDGAATIQSEELDRLELRLSEGGGHAYTGYLRVHDGLAPLPIGSRLDAETGVFTWQPGVAFVGTYDLVFVRWSGGHAVARQGVRVVLNAKGSGRVGPQVVIDVPLPPQGGSHEIATMDSIVVAGWAADLDSGIDTGVDTVHVWAYPTNGDDPIFVGAADYGGARPDVAAIYGERFKKTGYGITVQGLAPGTYDLAVFAYSTVRGGFVPAKVVRVTKR
jgi:hypothetical protein